MSDEIAGWIKERNETMEARKISISFISASASPDCKITVKNIKPKKKSWIEKIRDDLQARCNSAEAMRDHYKQVAETALWNSASNGRRLKFSTHGLKFLIEIGNPFTLCTMHYHGWIQNFYSIAMKNPKDQMDWKKAAVQSVENLCREWVGDRDIQSSIFEALFSAHPELRTK